MKKIIIIIIAMLTFILGYTASQQHTIRSAELLDEYRISFDDEVHTYMFKEVQQYDYASK